MHPHSKKNSSKINNISFPCRRYGSNAILEDSDIRISPAATGMDTSGRERTFDLEENIEEPVSRLTVDYLRGIITSVSTYISLYIS